MRYSFKTDKTIINAKIVSKNDKLFVFYVLNDGSVALNVITVNKRHTDIVRQVSYDPEVRSDVPVTFKPKRDRSRTISVIDRPPTGNPILELQRDLCI